MNYPNFSVLIATKDRPTSMRKLLESVAQSTIKPTTLVIISSGIPIHDVISDFKEFLNIDYFHSEVTGQVNQKKIGILKLRKEIPWVVFLDDDLILAPDAFEKAFDTLSKYCNSERAIVGIGFGLTPTSRIDRSSQIQNFISRAFLLNSEIPGKVLRSGQGVSYLENPKPIYTEWLNGASMWRIESVFDYSSLVPTSKYAACEDLVYSYNQHKNGALLYVPDARVYFQHSELNDYNRSEAIISGTAWRYFFVKSNPELCEWQMLYSQFGRLAYILLDIPWNRKSLRAGIWSVWHLFIAILKRKDSMYLINKIS